MIFSFLIRLTSLISLCCLGSCQFYSYYTQKPQIQKQDSTGVVTIDVSIQDKINKTKVIFEPNNNYALIFKNELLHLMNRRDNNDEGDYRFVLMVNFSYTTMFAYIGNIAVVANYKLYDLKNNSLDNIVTDEDFEKFYAKEIGKGVSFATKKTADDGSNDGTIAGVLTMDSYKSSLERKYTAKYNFFNEELSQNKDVLSISSNSISKNLMYSSTVNLPQSAYETDVAMLNVIAETVAKQTFEGLILDFNNNDKANKKSDNALGKDNIKKTQYPKEELEMFNKKVVVNKEK